MCGCAGGSVPALMLSRSRRIHGGGGVWKGKCGDTNVGSLEGGWRTQQSAIGRSGGGNLAGHLVGWLSGNNIDDAIDVDNINDKNMMMEMMMIPIT